MKTRAAVSARDPFARPDRTYITIWSGGGGKGRAYLKSFTVYVSPEEAIRIIELAFRKQRARG